MLYFVRTTNTCRPTNITILRCELDILGYNTAIFEVPSYFFGTDGDGTSEVSL